LLVDIDNALIEIKADRTKKTYSTYKSSVNKLIDYLHSSDNSDMLTMNLSKSFCKQFLQDEAEQSELANSGYNNVKGKCAAVFARLVEDEKVFLQINPFHGIKNRKETETRIGIWDPEDLERYFDYCRCENPEMYMASLFLFQAYVRPVELGRLRKKHIYLRDYVADITVRKGKEYKEALGSLSLELASLLRNRIESMGSEAFIFSHGLKPGMNQIGSSSFEKRFNAIKKKLNFNRMESVFYELKHTGVSIMVKNKVPKENIQTQCRHDKMETTEIYIRRLNRIGDDYFKYFPSFKKIVRLYSV
jgi:integrase